MDVQTERNRILLVEDEEHTRSSMEYILQTAGYAVESARNGRVGLERMVASQAEKLDLVVTDLMMPEMGGVDMMEAALARGVTVPFLVTTGHGDKRLLQHLIRIGCDDYLDKPFSRDDLLQSVARVLAKNKERAQELRQGHDANALRLESLVEQYRQRMGQMNQERDEARKVYQSLVGVPHSARLQLGFASHPLSDMGGDLCLVADHGDKTWILMADVAGHDLAASYHSVLLRTLFDEQVREQGNGDGFLELLNHLLLEVPNEQRMICALTVTIDHARREALVRSACLPPLVLMDGEGRLQMVPSDSGTPLGIYDQLEVVEATVKLTEGHRMVLYTDGVTEAKQITGATGKPLRYGIGHLAEAVTETRSLPAKEAADRIIHSVLQFCRQKPTDDLMVACIDLPEAPCSL